MSAAKQDQWVPAVLVRLARLFGSGSWLFTVSFLLIASACLAMLWLWQRYGDAIMTDPRFRLTSERLQVSPQPVWIKKADIKSDAILRGRLQGADIRDPELTPRIYRAFLNSPWVREVQLVNKSSVRASGINVRLTYRQPVAMVIVEAKRFADVDYDLGLYPVDVDGHVLPPDFTLEEANAYPKIGNVKTHPAGSFGESWGDRRVAAAAKIIDLLSDAWTELKLYRVDVPDLPALAAGAPYRLVDRDGGTMVWGSGPGEERPGEENTAEKIARLRKFLAKPDKRMQAASTRLIPNRDEPEVIDDSAARASRQ